MLLAFFCLFAAVSTTSAGMVEVEPHVFCSFDKNGVQRHCVNLTPPPVRTFGETYDEQPTETLPSASAPAVSAPAVSAPATASKVETKKEEVPSAPAAASSSSSATEQSYPGTVDSNYDDAKKKAEREAHQRLLHQKSKEALGLSRQRLRSRGGYGNVESIEGADQGTTSSGPDYNAIGSTGAAVGALVKKQEGGLAPPQDGPVCVAGDIAAELQEELDKEREEIDQKLKEIEDELRKRRAEAEKEKRKLEKDKELDKKIKGRKQAKKERKDLNDKRDKLNKKRDKLVEENDKLEADKEGIDKERKDLNKKMQKARKGDPNCRGAACRKLRGQLEDNSRRRVENIKNTGKFQQKWERHRREQRNLAREQAKFEAKLDKGFGQSKEQWKARQARKQARAYSDQMWKLRNRKEALESKRRFGSLSRSEAKELNEVTREYRGLSKNFGDATTGNSKFDARARKMEAKLSADGTTSIDEAVRLDADKINADYKALDDAVKGVEQARDDLRNPQNKADPKKAQKAIRDHEKAQKDVERYRKEYADALKKQPVKYPPVDESDINKARKKYFELKENGGSYREVQDALKEYENLQRADERHWREETRRHKNAQEKVGNKLDEAYEREERLRPLANAGQARKFVDGFNREVRDITGKDGKIDVAKVDAKARQVDRNLAGVAGANAEIAQLNGVRKNLAPGKNGGPSVAERMGLGKDAVKGRLNAVDKKLASARRLRDKYAKGLSAAGLKNKVNPSGQCVVEAATTKFAWAYVKGSRAAANRQKKSASAPKVAMAKGKGTASPAAGQTAKNASQAQNAKQAQQARQAQQYKAPGCSAGGGPKTTCTASRTGSKLARLDRMFHGAPKKKPSPQLASAPARYKAVPSALIAGGVVGGAAAGVLSSAQLEAKIGDLQADSEKIRQSASQAASDRWKAESDAKKAREAAMKARERAYEIRNRATQVADHNKDLSLGYGGLAQSAEERAKALRAKAKAERAAAARYRAAAARYERKAAESKDDKRLAADARQAAANNIEDAQAREKRAAELEAEAKTEEAQASERRAKQVALTNEAKEFDARATAAEEKAAQLEAVADRRRASAQQAASKVEQLNQDFKTTRKKLETAQAQSLTRILEKPPGEDFYSKLPSKKRLEWLRRHVAGWDRLTINQKTRIIATIQYAEARQAAVNRGKELDDFAKSRNITPETLTARAEAIKKLKKQLKTLKDEKFHTNDEVNRMENLKAKIKTETLRLNSDIKEFMRLRERVMQAGLEAQRRLWAADPDSRHQAVSERVGLFAGALGHLRLGREAAAAREKAFAKRKGILERKRAAAKRAGLTKEVARMNRQLERLEAARKEWAKLDARNIETLERVVKNIRWDIASQAISDKLFEISDEDRLQKRAQAFLDRDDKIDAASKRQDDTIRLSVSRIDLKDPKFSASKAVLDHFDSKTTEWAINIGGAYGLIKGGIKGLVGLVKLFIWEPIDYFGEKFEASLQRNLGFRPNLFGTDNQEFLEAFEKDPAKMAKAMFFGLGKQIYDFTRNVKGLGQAVTERDAGNALKKSVSSAEFIGEFFLDPTILLGGIGKVVTALRAGGKVAAGLKAADKVLGNVPSGKVLDDIADAGKNIDAPPPLPANVRNPKLPDSGNLPKGPKAAPGKTPDVAVAPNNPNPGTRAPRGPGRQNPPARPARGPPVGGKCGVQRQLFMENCGLVAAEAVLKDLGIVLSERVQGFLWHFAHGKGLLAQGKGMTVLELAEYLRLTGIAPRRMAVGFHSLEDMGRALAKGREVLVNIQNGAGGYHWVRLEKIGKDAKGNWWVSFGEGGLPKGLSNRIPWKEFDRITRHYPGSPGNGHRLRSLMIDTPAMTAAEKLAARILALENAQLGKKAVQPVPNNPVQQAPLPKNPIGRPPGAPQPLPDISSAPGKFGPPRKSPQPKIEYPSAGPLKNQPTIEFPKAAQKPKPVIEQPKGPAPAVAGNTPKRTGPGGTANVGPPRPVPVAKAPPARPRAPKASPKKAPDAPPPGVTIDQSPFDIRITLPDGRRVVLELGDKVGTGSFTVVQRLDNMKGYVVKVTKGGVTKSAVILDKVGYDILQSLPKGFREFVVRTPEIIHDFKIRAANDKGLVNGSLRIAQEAPPTFWDATRGIRGMTLKQAELFRKVQRVLNESGAVWLDNKANNFGFELARNGKTRLVIHDTGGIVPLLGEGAELVRRAKIFQRWISSPPKSWINRYNQAGKAVADNLAAWRRADALPKGTPGRKKRLEQAEKAFNNALEAQQDIPFQYRDKLMKEFGHWIDTKKMGVKLDDIQFNPVNGFRYPKPRHLIANDNTPQSLQRALRTASNL